MNGHQDSAKIPQQQRLEQLSPAPNYYTLLGVKPSASVGEIRRAYRDLSKRYHPDTTILPKDVATVKFRELNNAYSILSHAERRVSYDQQIRYSYLNRDQVPGQAQSPISDPASESSRSAYLDPTDRPLSAGEVFALFMMGLSLVGCLALAILIAWLRGDGGMETL